MHWSHKDTRAGKTGNCAQSSFLRQTHSCAGCSSEVDYLPTLYAQGPLHHRHHPSSSIKLLIKTKTTTTNNTESSLEGDLVKLPDTWPGGIKAHTRGLIRGCSTEPRCILGAWSLGQAWSQGSHTHCVVPFGCWVDWEHKHVCPYPCGRGQVPSLSLPSPVWGQLLFPLFPPPPPCQCQVPGSSLGDL